MFLFRSIMPEPYWTKRKPYPLSSVVENRHLVRVLCRYCKRQQCYRPDDLIQIYGDVDVDSLMGRMKCEGGPDHGYLDVSSFSPTGSELIGLRIRQLKYLKMIRVPVWRDD